KDEGGFVFAQEESTADFAEMPKSAIRTGCVDFVRAPREMGPELAMIGSHPYLRAAEMPADSGTPAAPVANAASIEAAHKRAFRLLQSADGVDFAHYKRSTIERRIARRMAMRHLDGVPAYVDFLQANP